MSKGALSIWVALLLASPIASRVEGQGSTPISISMPTVTVFPGDRAEIAVALTGVEGRTVEAGEIEVRFDADLLTLEGVVTAGALIAGWALEQNTRTVDGHQTLKLAFASDRGFSDDGNLFALTFLLANSAPIGTISYIDILSGSLEQSPDGSPAPVQLGRGAIWVRASLEILANRGVTLEEGGSAGLDRSALETVDAKDGAGDLVYTVVTGFEQGSLTKEGAVLSAGATFTQAEVNAGALRYAHDGGEEVRDQFQFTVRNTKGETKSGIFSAFLTPVNDAPVLENLVDMLLTSILQNTENPSGSPLTAIIASAGGDRITDAEGDPEGMAVVGVDGTNGSWQYSLDGGSSWSSLTGVTEGEARLLESSHKIRFVPATGWYGTAELLFRAWDRTVGVGGQTEDVRVNGGRTPFSAALGTVSIRVHRFNQAPVLDNSGEMALSALAEDVVDPSGDQVAAIIASAGGDRIVDADGDPEGIAVVEVDETHGLWEYSLDGGSSWSSLSRTDDPDARLLEPSAKIRFVPLADFFGTVVEGLRFRAWDGVIGVSGETADAREVGGFTAFSEGVETVSVAVTPVADPPVAVDDVVSVGEDATTTIVVLTNDVDGDGDVLALASYSDPTSGALTAGGEGILLYRPKTDYNGPDRFTYVVDDGTGRTATGSVSITVTPVNDAPVLDNSGEMRLPAVAEDVMNPAGERVGVMVAAAGGDRVTDADGDPEGIAVVAVDETNGIWEYSTDDGATWRSLSEVSWGSARLLGPAAKLRFLPRADFFGEVSEGLRFLAWDWSTGLEGGLANAIQTGGSSAFSQISEVVDVEVTPVNDAPVMDVGGDMRLTAIEEGSADPAGDRVAAIVASAGGNRITDVDGDPEGIAVVGVDETHGRWEYSTDDGLSWESLSGVSDGAARLLDDAAKLRFVPTAGWDGEATLELRAWDRTSGISGGLADANQAGGIGPFSEAIETVSIAVTHLNDAPVLDGSAEMRLISIIQDVSDPEGDRVAMILASAGGDRVADVDGDPLGMAVVGVDETHGRWEYSRNDGLSWGALSGVSEGNARLLDGAARVRFVPAAGWYGIATFEFKAWDQTGGIAGGRENASLNGARTPFSSATASASIAVIPEGIDWDGRLVAAMGVSEPVPLPSTANSSSLAVDILDFSIVDGGTGDGRALEIAQIALHASGTGPFAKMVFRLNGPDASRVEGAYSAAFKTITFSGLAISVTDGQTETYTVSAYFGDNTGLDEGQTLSVSLDGDVDLVVGFTSTQMAENNEAVGNGAGSGVTVAATRLALATPPADGRRADVGDEVVSGLAFQTQPAVQGQDEAGNVDRDFADAVSVRLVAGEGGLSGSLTATAVAGTATFADLRYAAVVDGEAFTLSFDDEVGGAGGDLPAVSSSGLSADVVATQLAFTAQPGNGVHAQPLSSAPVVQARDVRGIVDLDFSASVTLALEPAGSLVNQVVAAVAGEASFGALMAYGVGTDRSLRATSPPVGEAASAPFSVDRAPATIILGNLWSEYNGKQRPATAGTEPPGLAVGITYNGRAEAPVEPGRYQVQATIVDPNYTGSAGAHLDIIASPPPGVELRALRTEGNAPLVVTFWVETSGVFDEIYLETFDDAGQRVGDLSRPVRATYSQPGMHVARLTVKSPGGDGISEMTITVYGPPEVEEITAGEGVEDGVLILDLEGVDGSADQEGSAWSVEDADSGLIEKVEIEGDAIRFVPVENAHGSDRVTVVRTNRRQLSSSQEVELTWMAVDDAPEIVGLEDPTGAAEETEIAVGGVEYARDVDTDVGGLVWAAEGFDAGLVETAEGGAEGIVFSPWPDAVGGTRATIALIDPATGNRAEQEIVLEWTQVNDPPTMPRTLFPEDGATEVSQAPLLAWEAEDADGEELVFDLYLGGDGESLLPLATGVRNGSFSLERLAPETAYTWRVVARDAAGEEAEADFGFTTRVDRVPPVFSQVRIAVTDGSAVIGWATDEPALGEVRYRTEGGREEVAVERKAATRHRAVLEGLEKGTWYDFELTATDDSGNAAKTRPDRFLTLAEADEQPPRILLGPFVAGATPEGMVVSWVTDEPSSGRVRWFAGEKSGEVESAELVEEHRVRLSGLEPETTYRFEVESADLSGNLSAVGQGTFTTPGEVEGRPPTFISGPAVLSLADETAVVAFVADELVSARVRYDVDSELNDGGLVRSVGMGEEGQLDLTGLSRGTRYYYRVSIVDESGNVRQSELLSLRTQTEPDLRGPGILAGPVVEGVTDGSGILVVHADEPSRVRVLLSRKADLSNPAVKEEGTLRREHRLLLTRLERDAEYFYAVELRDAFGNVSAPKQGQFRTLLEPDETPPRIVLGPFVTGILQEGGTVVLRSNEPTTGRVRYGPTEEVDAGEVWATSLAEEHRIRLNGLSPGGEYFVRAEVRDATGQSTESAVVSFTTRLEADEEVPLLVSGPEIEGTTDRSAIVRVEYDEPVELSLSYENSTGGVAVMQRTERREEHRVELVGLERGMEYRATLQARDATGHLSAETQISFLTRATADERAPIFVRGPVAQSVTAARAQIAWRLDEPGDGTVEVKEVGTTGMPQTFRVLRRSREQVVEVVGLRGGTMYEFQVRSADGSGNVSSSPMIFFTAPDREDTEPPVVEAGPVVQSATESSIAIFWRTDEPATAHVSYGLEDGELLRTVSRGRLETEHVVVLTHLERDTPYAVEVRSRDRQGSESGVQRLQVRTLAQPDGEMPRLLGRPTVAEVKRDRALIRWRTDEPATSRVQFGADADYGTEEGDGGFVQEHAVALTNLTPGSVYHFRVGSVDRAGNGPVWSSDFALTTPLESDDSPPEFTRVPAVRGLTEKRVSLSFASSEPAAVAVAYGSTLDYELGTVTRAALQTEHEVRINKLQADQLYYFRVGLTDGAGNGPAERELAVRTLAAADKRGAQILTGPIVVGRTVSEAVVEWSTDEPADSQVEYGREGEDVASRIDPEDRTMHQMVLTNLAPGERYLFRVASTDGAGNGPTWSAPLSFATLDLPDLAAPALTGGPVVENVTRTQATVRWRTDEPATGAIDYGISATYGSRVEDGRLAREHELRLADLAPGTTYHFAVASTDIGGLRMTTAPDGNELWSADHSFTTRAEEDTRAPVMSATPTAVRTDRSAVVRWSTDEPSTSRVEWFNKEESGFVEDNEPVREHSLTLTGLKPRTAHWFRVISRDAADNELVWPEDLDVERLRRMSAAKLLQLPERGELFITDDFADVDPPMIIQPPRVSERTANSLTLTWETDELADSFVRYGITEELGEVVGAARDVLKHEVTLTNLEPGRRYYYVVSSTDPSGNRPAERGAGVASTAAAVDLEPPNFVDQPRVLARTDETAVILFQTDEPAAAQVVYRAEGSEESLSLQSLERRSEHQIALSQLSAGTEYTLAISATDASGNRARAPEDLLLRTAQFPDETPPQIVAGPEIVGLGDRSAAIEWSTDEPASSSVGFSLSPYLRIAPHSTQAVVEHRVVLTRLEPGASYYYAVASTDASGNGPVQSDMVEFTTLSEADETPPAIPGGLLARSGHEVVRLEWEAEAEEDLVGYDVYRETEEGLIPIATRVAVPWFVDEGLTDGQEYRYRIAAVDGRQPPNRSELSEAVAATPGTDGVPAAPAVLGLERSADPARPVVVLENATPAVGDEVLTYTILVASNDQFGDVVARVGKVAEGATGQSRWRVDRKLEAEVGYWYRARAFDGTFAGLWSDPVMLRGDAAVAPAGGELPGDFDGDGVVGFADFFLFADGFGGGDPALDLDGDGVVGFSDFFLFADRFGTRAAGKGLRSMRTQVAVDAAVEVEALGVGEEILVDLHLEGVERVKGYGFTVSADQPVTFVGAVDSLRDAENGPLTLGLPEGNRVHVAGHLRGRQPEGSLEQVPLVRLRFRVNGRPRDVQFSVEGGLLSRGPGRLVRVPTLGAARVVPQTYALWQNFPNPFNPETSIPFAVPARPEGEGELAVFNALGQLIRVWDLRGYGPGYHAVIWDGRDRQGREVGSGMYIARLRVGKMRQGRKLVLIR